jgi:hypothetical protein
MRDANWQLSESGKMVTQPVVRVGLWPGGGASFVF